MFLKNQPNLTYIFDVIITMFLKVIYATSVGYVDNISRQDI